MTAAIEIERLRVDRGGVTVIYDLTLSIPAGQVVGLLGPSGSGKSTLIRAIAGVQIVRSGAISVLGEPAGSAPLRSRIGYVTQQPSLYDDLSVEANLAYFARVMGRSRAAAAADVERVLDAVDLHSHRRALAHRLSGGQRARVSLGAALIGAPDLYLFDEPTVGLDPVLRRSLWELFHRLVEGGASMLVSSHVMDEAMHCDRLLLMRDGRIIADDAVTGILADTGAPDVEHAFLTLIDRGEAS